MGWNEGEIGLAPGARETNAESQTPASAHVQRRQLKVVSRGAPVHCNMRGLSVEELAGRGSESYILLEFLCNVTV